MPDGGLWENLGPRQSAKWSGKKKDDHQECISHTQVNGRWIKGSLPQTSKKPPCVFFLQCTTVKTPVVSILKYLYCTNLS